MNMTNYQIIARIAELKSFSRCAQELHLTPSAISHTVRKMEQEFGFSLFLRTNSSSEVLPTRECKAILPELYAILRAEGNLSTRVLDLQKRENGHICLATFNSFCVNELTPLVASYRKTHPDVTIAIMQGGYLDVNTWVSSFQADLGFVGSYQEKQFLSTTVMRDEMLCVTPEDMTFSHEDYVTKEELTRQTIIMQHHDYGAESNRILENLGLTGEFENLAYDDDAILAMIENGLGISFLPSLALKRCGFRIRTFSLEEKDFRPICMIQSPNMPLSPAASGFAQFIREHYHVNDPKQQISYSYCSLNGQG